LGEIRRRPTLAQSLSNTLSKDEMPKPLGETPEEQKRSFWLQFGRYSQLAFALPAATIAGWLLGSALDRWLHTSWISVVGLFLGIAAGLIELVRTALRDMH
jgi:F0F1-type ATP synthase assembly protein I